MASSDAIPRKVPLLFFSPMLRIICRSIIPERSSSSTESDYWQQHLPCRAPQWQSAKKDTKTPREKPVPPRSPSGKKQANHRREREQLILETGVGFLHMCPEQLLTSHIPYGSAGSKGRQTPLSQQSFWLSATFYFPRLFGGKC